ncbi:MAG: cell envelope integrity protein TolA, partial [Pseudomonadota bacterium]
ESSQFRPQDAGGWKPGLAMAFFIHLFLIGGLALSVNWKIQPPPAAVEAEMWTEVPKIEDVVPPVPVPPPPVVLPPKPVEPEPAVEKPADKPADMAIVPVKPKVPKPKVEKEDKKPLKKDPKKEPKPKEVFLPDPPKKAPVKTDTKPAKPVVDPKAEAKAKAAADAQAKADAEKLAAQRRANLDRLMRNLAQDQISSAGLSDSYIGRIVARVKSNIVFPRDGVDGNPAALVKVECAADGRITRSTVIAASGNQQWDQAVIRALERTQVLPLDEHKRVPCPFEINFRPNDF